MSDNPRYLTASEAATELRISRSKVLSWLRSGKLRGSDVSRTPGIGKARWRISRSDLDDFLAGRQPKPTITTRRQRAKKPSGWVKYF
jgi:excisionase family DNA binding protein